MLWCLKGGIIELLRSWQSAGVERLSHAAMANGNARLVKMVVEVLSDHRIV